MLKKKVSFHFPSDSNSKGGSSIDGDSLRKQRFLQLFTSEGDPFFIELRSGKAHWILPEGTTLQQVRIMAHEAEDGHPYFENLVTNEVSWNLPSDNTVMSEESRNNAISLQLMDRTESEQFIGELFSEELSAKQMSELDEFLLNDPQYDDDNDVENVTHSISNSSSNGSAASQLFKKASLCEDQQQMLPPTTPSCADKSNSSNSGVIDNRGSPLVDNSPINGRAKSVVDGDDNINDSDSESDQEDKQRRKSFGSTKKTLEQVQAWKVKSGFLMKLAKKSNRNWKKRFCVLNPFNISYYENDKPNQIPKGEMQITASTAIAEGLYDKKYGFLFVVTNEWESITLAATTEIDRQHWMKALRSALEHADCSLRSYATLLFPFLPGGGLAASKRSKSGDKLPMVQKYFILSKNLLSFHPSWDNTSIIEGVININRGTKDMIDEGDFLISLVDPDDATTKICFQFNACPQSERKSADRYPIKPGEPLEKLESLFDEWKKALLRMMGRADVMSAEVDSPAATTATATGRASLETGDDDSVGRDSMRESTAARLLASAAVDTAALSAVKKPPLPTSISAASFAGVQIFGLADAADDDEEEDEQESTAAAGETGPKFITVVPTHQTTTAASDAVATAVEKKSSPLEALGFHTVNETSGDRSSLSSNSSSSIKTGSESKRSNALERARVRRSKGSDSKGNADASVPNRTRVNSSDIVPPPPPPPPPMTASTSPSNNTFATAASSASTAVAATSAAVAASNDVKLPFAPPPPPPPPVAAAMKQSPRQSQSQFRYSTVLKDYSSYQKSSLQSLSKFLQDEDANIAEADQNNATAVVVDIAADANDTASVTSAATSATSNSSTASVAATSPGSITRTSSLSSSLASKSKQRKKLMAASIAKRKSEKPVAAVATVLQEEQQQQQVLQNNNSTIQPNNDFIPIGQHRSRMNKRGIGSSTATTVAVDASSSGDETSTAADTLTKPGDAITAAAAGGSSFGYDSDDGASSLSLASFTVDADDTSSIASGSTGTPSKSAADGGRNALETARLRKLRKSVAVTTAGGSDGSLKAFGSSSPSLDKGLLLAADALSQQQQQQFGSDRDSLEKQQQFPSSEETSPGRINALQLFKENKNKPLVRMIFDNYCSADAKVVDIDTLQHLCYDFGVYLSQIEIKVSLKSYSKRSSLPYDDFMVWWRSNDKFSKLKLNDTRTARKIAAAALFKAYDRSLEGQIKEVYFNFVFRDLVEFSHVSKKESYAAVAAKLDPNAEGIIEFNSYISWIDVTELPSQPKRSTLSKLFSGFSSPGRRSSTAVTSTAAATAASPSKGRQSPAATAAAAAADSPIAFGSRSGNSFAMGVSPMSVRSPGTSLGSAAFEDIAEAASDEEVEHSSEDDNGNNNSSSSSSNNNNNNNKGSYSRGNNKSADLEIDYSDYNDHTDAGFGDNSSDKHESVQQQQQQQQQQQDFDATDELPRQSSLRVSELTAFSADADEDYDDIDDCDAFNARESNVVPTDPSQPLHSITASVTDASTATAAVALAGIPPPDSDIFSSSSSNNNNSNNKVQEKQQGRGALNALQRAAARKKERQSILQVPGVDREIMRTNSSSNNNNNNNISNNNNNNNNNSSNNSSNNSESFASRSEHVLQDHQYSVPIAGSDSLDISFDAATAGGSLKGRTGSVGRAPSFSSLYSEGVEAGSSGEQAVESVQFSAKTRSVLRQTMQRLKEEAPVQRSATTTTAVATIRMSPVSSPVVAARRTTMSTPVGDLLNPLSNPRRQLSGRKQFAVDDVTANVSTTVAATAVDINSSSNTSSSEATQVIPAATESGSNLHSEMVKTPVAKPSAPAPPAAASPGVGVFGWDANAVLSDDDDEVDEMPVVPTAAPAVAIAVTSVANPTRQNSSTVAVRPQLAAVAAPVKVTAPPVPPPPPVVAPQLPSAAAPRTEVVQPAVPPAAAPPVLIQPTAVVVTPPVVVQQPVVASSTVTPSAVTVQPVMAPPPPSVVPSTAQSEGSVALLPVIHSKPTAASKASASPQKSRVLAAYRIAARSRSRSNNNTTASDATTAADSAEQNQQQQPQQLQSVVNHRRDSINFVNPLSTKSSAAAVQPNTSVYPVLSSRSATTAAGEQQMVPPPPPPTPPVPSSKQSRQQQQQQQQQSAPPVVVDLLPPNLLSASVDHSSELQFTPSRTRTLSRFDPDSIRAQLSTPSPFEYSRSGDGDYDLIALESIAVSPIAQSMTSSSPAARAIPISPATARTSLAATTTDVPASNVKYIPSHQEFLNNTKDTLSETQERIKRVALGLPDSALQSPSTASIAATAANTVVAAPPLPTSPPPPPSITSASMFRRTAAGPATTAASAAGAMNKINAFEELLRQRESIDQAMRELQLMETAATDRISARESAAKLSIREDADRSLNAIAAAEKALEEKVSTHRMIAAKEANFLMQSRKQLQLEERTLQQQYKERMLQTLQFAEALVAQQKNMEAEKKKIRQQRYQLDMSMQSMNLLNDQLTAELQATQELKENLAAEGAAADAVRWQQRVAAERLQQQQRQQEEKQRRQEEEELQQLLDLQQQQEQRNNGVQQWHAENSFLQQQQHQQQEEIRRLQNLHRQVQHDPNALRNAYQQQQQQQQHQQQQQQQQQHEIIRLHGSPFAAAELMQSIDSEDDSSVFAAVAADERWLQQQQQQQQQHWEGTEELKMDSSSAAAAGIFSQQHQQQQQWFPQSGKMQTADLIASNFLSQLNSSGSQLRSSSRRTPGQQRITATTTATKGSGSSRRAVGWDGKAPLVRPRYGTPTNVPTASSNRGRTAVAIGTSTGNNATAAVSPLANRLRHSSPAAYRVVRK